MVAVSYGTVESGLREQENSSRSSTAKTLAATAAVLLLVAAVALVASQSSQRVVLENTEDGENRLYSNKVNLDHWPWDRKPPANGAGEVEEFAPVQILAAGKMPVIVRDFESKENRLYRHAYSDAYGAPKAVSIGDVIANPVEYLNTPE